MRFIDVLSGADLFGDAVMGLALLLPSTFEWSKRGIATRGTHVGIEEAVHAVLLSQPGLRRLAQELLPYARWIIGEADGHEGLPPPVLAGLEDAAWGR